MNLHEGNTSESQHPPIGIDLGTTYSVVAYVDSTGRPVTVLNGVGEMLTPSAVLFDDEDVVVGREAARASVMEPDAYAECFKRDIGGSVYHRKIGGVDVPPEVLSAFVLERLKADAELRLGQPIRQVVITVPAFFDETRRKATQDAGRLAGLEVYHSCHKPKQTEHYLELAKKYDLLVTGGTDFHGFKNPLEAELGDITIPDELVEKLRDEHLRRNRS